MPPQSRPGFNNGKPSTGGDPLSGSPTGGKSGVQPPASSGGPDSKNWELQNQRGIEDWRKYIARQPASGSQGTSNNTALQKDQLDQTGERAPTMYPYGQTTGNELIPLYCAIMGLVIVGLIFYVVYKHWRQRQAGAPGKLHSQSSGVGMGGMEVGFAGLPTKRSSKLNHHKTPSGGSQDQPLLRVIPVCSASVDMQRKPICRPEDRMYRDLPEKHRNRIEASLVEAKNGAGWKELAHELGLAQAEIAAYESGDSVTVTAIRKILSDWGTRDTASLAELSRALQAIGRHDVLDTVYPGSNGKPEATVVTEMGHV